DKFFGVDVGIAKGGLRFAARRFIGGKELFLLADDAHAAAATAGNGLQNQGVADAGGFLGKLFLAVDDAIAARYGRQTCSTHFAPGTILLAHDFNHFGGGADEGDFGGFADLGEVGVLREETVARVDGVDVGDFGGADDLRNIEVAFAAAWRADANGFVSKAHVQRVAVRLGVDCDRRDAQLFARTDDPQGDFPAVGD